MQPLLQGKFHSVDCNRWAYAAAQLLLCHPDLFAAPSEVQAAVWSTIGTAVLHLPGPPWLTEL